MSITVKQCLALFTHAQHILQQDKYAYSMLFVCEPVCIDQAVSPALHGQQARYVKQSMYSYTVAGDWRALVAEELCAAAAYCWVAYA